MSTVSLRALATYALRHNRIALSLKDPSKKVFIKDLEFIGLWENKGDFHAASESKLILPLFRHKVFEFSDVLEFYTGIKRPLSQRDAASLRKAIDRDSKTKRTTQNLQGRTNRVCWYTDARFEQNDGAIDFA